MFFSANNICKFSLHIFTEAWSAPIIFLTLVIVLCLGNKALRDVVKKGTATSMWSRLLLYVMKLLALAQRQFLKEQLYSFRTVESKTITEQLTEFNKILDDLENIEDDD